MLHPTDDVRIERLRPLLPPQILMEELPCSAKAAETIAHARAEVDAIVTRQDPRLLVVVGPCSVHDPDSAREYAARLKPVADRLSGDLRILMRVYFEKPRTTVGWKGLINDPDLDGSFNINKGLRAARGLLSDLAEMGMPVGTELLDTITPQFIADLVSWGAIGARTTESQVHRELASGLSMAVGFKNGTSGDVQIAVDAVKAAQAPHRFLSVTKQGISAIVATKGNPTCHVILRGGRAGPNYSAEMVGAALEKIDKAGLETGVMVDCSHANSGKDPNRQPAVAEALSAQVEAGNRAIMGVMIESNLEGGRQNLEPGKALVPGQSITDGCLSWEATVPVLERLATAARSRR